MAQIWWFIFLGLELAKCWYSIRGPRVAMKYPSSVTFLGWWWVYRDPVFLKCCLEKETSKGSGNGHELNHLDFDTFKTWFKEWDSLQIAWGGSFFFFRLMAQRGTRNPQMGIFTFAPQTKCQLRTLVQQNSSQQGLIHAPLGTKTVTRVVFSIHLSTVSPYNRPWTLETQSWWRNSFHSVNGFFRFL